MYSTEHLSRHDTYNWKDLPPEKTYKTLVDALFETSREIARSIADKDDDGRLLDFAMFRVEQLARFGLTLEKNGAKLDPEPGSLALKWTAHVESFLESGELFSVSAV